MNEELKTYLRDNEYYIPCRLQYLAFKCPLVTWEEAMKLYQLSVEEVKIFLDVKYICDAPFGIGFSSVKDNFTKKIRALQAVREQKKKKEENNYYELRKEL